MEPRFKNVHCLSGMSGTSCGQESRTLSGLEKTNKRLEFSKIIELIIE